MESYKKVNESVVEVILEYARDILMAHHQETKDKEGVISFEEYMTTLQSKNDKIDEARANQSKKSWENWKNGIDDEEQAAIRELIQERDDYQRWRGNRWEESCIHCNLEEIDEILAYVKEGYEKKISRDGRIIGMFGIDERRPVSR